MDILSSVFVFCGTVSQTDTEYKVLAKRLAYELKKAEHLAKSQKVKNVPKFMLENLHHKIKQAKTHLQKIQSLLTEDRISFKEKLKLSLPFNKTNMLVKSSIQQLQKAQTDVNQYSTSSESQNNGKRQIEDFKKMTKKQDTMISILPNDEVNDQDIDEALMGPTIEEDAAIEFTRNKYVILKIQIHGNQKIINLIKEIDASFLVCKKKVHIKFQTNEKKDVDELELFSLGRLHFKPVYGKLKNLWADIDRISKQNHFVVKLKRKRENIKHHTVEEEKPEKKQSAHKSAQKGEAVDEFFSFPCTDEQIVMKQIDTIVVERSTDKNVYFSDETGAWRKMNEIEKEICRGEQIAPYIAANKNPQVPDLYFKINFEILE